MERAKGGTVFLDEIGDMDIKLQAKLLRVLQDGDYRRVGGTEPLKADVRVVAATNRDLASLIVSGAFREDLYYRLSVICLHAPALRERAEDIPLLARHFCADFSRHYGKKTPELDDGLLSLLMAQPWPGNVRELKNCLERAIIFCDDAKIGPEHLPRQYRGSLDRPVPIEGREENAAMQEGAALSGAHDALERNLLMDALKRAGGNRTKAAEILGIHRRTLYYKLERLGLDGDGVARAP
jgi:DNA-binding NtrC family response regulator